LEGLRLENVDVFHGRLEYFTDNWSILCLFGMFIFPVLGIMYQENCGNRGLVVSKN
jgi:hypothetical protein